MKADSIFARRCTNTLGSRRSGDRAVPRDQADGVADGVGSGVCVELRAAVRQRQVYLARVAFLVALLTIPAVGVWMNSELPSDGVEHPGHAMRVFARFSYAVLATIQLTLVLLVAPAAATDAFGAPGREVRWLTCL